MSERSGTETRQRTKQVGVRLSPDEYARLLEMSERDGVSPGSVLRRALSDERWWISDGHVDFGAEKILGPFESRDLALDVRRLYEDHPDARGLTFWVSLEGKHTRPTSPVRGHDADQGS